MLYLACIYIGLYGICGDQCYDYSKERCCESKGKRFVFRDSLYDYTKQAVVA